VSPTWVERAVARARAPAAWLYLAGLSTVLLPLVAGLAPLAPALVLAVAFGADAALVGSLAVLWGALPLVAAFAGVPTGLCLIVAGLEIQRLRSRGLALAALLLAVPLAVAAASAQLLLTPCTGLFTGLVVLALTLFAVVRGATALNDVVIDAGFRGSLRPRGSSGRG